jgi:hypothetical protein
MIKKAKRYFNTSVPNIPQEHYTLKREPLIQTGSDLVKKKRYFTIWAPRQSGKSTYFLMLSELLKKKGYQILHINVENFASATEESFLKFLANEFEEAFKIEINATTFSEFYDQVKRQKGPNRIFIIDEVEGLNPSIFGQFLHTIRNLYHFRESHSFKSIILVGVSNIVGVIQDNASPFNIADNLEVPYFTHEETKELLQMHEAETNQRFGPEVKEKISYITGNQPGLVNSFAYQLVQRNPDKPVIDYSDYLKVEDWYINIAVDKNISNIINKAKQHRLFVESLLFSEKSLKFTINDERMKFLSSYGVITNNDEGLVEFNVPLYKKALMHSFYPYSNGESDYFFRDSDFKNFFTDNAKINFKSLIHNYKTYVKKRSFKYFREKDKETGEYLNLKEAALAYSFETYIQVFLQEVEGKSYLEPSTGLGRCDLLINLKGHEYVIEFKIYRNLSRFQKGKDQVSYYARSMKIPEAIYLVFVPHTVKLPGLKEETAIINDVMVHTFIIPYDEEKDF